ncbi:MAG: lipocalin-like domain-containing protein [Pleurocapsa minor GSE-CHR-MK-17-07R]|jgi:hypothetical protein|nr:lipocalin-like domain-containing protein [Pleurocapsa minor GSE-CHR-MK 17-07R]
MNTPVNAVKEQFVGSWELVADATLRRDGTSAGTYGDKPVGVLLYQPNGWMSVQVMRRNRRSGISMNSIHTARTEFMGYFGTFVVNADAGTVTHFVIGSSFPAYVNTQQLRRYTFEDDGATLILEADASAEGHLKRTLTWRRA